MAALLGLGIGKLFERLAEREVNREVLPVLLSGIVFGISVNPFLDGALTGAGIPAMSASPDLISGSIIFIALAVPFWRRLT